MDDTYRTLNPATGELIERFPMAGGIEIEEALARSADAFAHWRHRPVERRADLLLQLAEVLEGEMEKLAATMALEMGKPLADGEAEVRKSALLCRFYAERGDEFLTSEDLKDPQPARSAGVRYEPLGPILAIMPWNFPIWQVVRCAVPALLAGNVVVLKHAPSTPRCALEITRIFQEVGFPEGCLENLFLGNTQAAAVIAHSAVRGVSLTGSMRAGREVASAAGRALKPMVLELGGSDPFIVFADADVERAAETGAASRCLNGGQSCIAAKRFLIERSAAQEFTDKFVAAMRGRRVGDPREPGTEIGPLAREDLRSALARQVAMAENAGAEILCGGVFDAEAPGFFYPPTVLQGLAPDAAVAQEEIFGPVAFLYTFETEEQAVRLANGTAYGLGASVWTRDRDRIERLIPRIESGSLFFNGMVRSDPRLPFGGIKSSGFGRELAREGLLEWTNVKTIWVNDP